jgi:aspartate/methionine/tyrosine aminotransferase
LTEAQRLNEILMTEAPGAWAMLSTLGKRAAFPRGIPFQSAEAKDVALNATIGQVTDGHGLAIPLDVIREQLPGVNPEETFLYLPVAGPVKLRQRWLERQVRMAGGVGNCSLPIAVHGLTHGISLAAAMFTDPDTTVLIPDLHWGNYRLIFGYQGCGSIETYETFVDGVWDCEGLKRALDQVQGKVLVVLNFPNNPTGYMPTQDEAGRIVEILADYSDAMCVVCDDAYQSFNYEKECMSRSLFWDLSDALDRDRTFTIKVDGATKELLFFSSRIAFFTHNVRGEAEVAIESKAKAIIRATVGSVSGAASKIVERALASGRVESEVGQTMKEMRSRYEAVKASLHLLPEEVTPLPFNSAFFAVFDLPDRLSAEELRQSLLTDDVGVVALAEPNMIRIAYCSLDEARIPALMERISAHMRKLLA